MRACGDVKKSWKRWWDEDLNVGLGSDVAQVGAPRYPCRDICPVGHGSLFCFLSTHAVS